MTVRQMQVLFENLLGQYNKEILDRMQTDEVEIFLNHAQTKLMNREFVEIGTEQEREKINAKLGKFRSLTKVQKAIVAEVTNLTGIPNSKFFLLSSATDYMYYILSTSNVTRTDKPSPDFVVDNKLTSLELTKDFINNDFNKPYIRSPFVSLLEEGLVVIHDTETTINTIDLYYLRRAKRLTSYPILGVYTDYVNTSELPEEMHEELVTLAVQSAIAVKEPAKYQINLNESREVNT